MRRARALLLPAALSVPLLVGAGCALVPCSPYSCSDDLCGCVPAGPVWATARALPSAATASASAPPTPRLVGAGERMSY